MAKKEKSPLTLVEDIMKKFKTIYPNKFLLYNDSILINELQNPKNSGECNGTITSHIRSPYKEAIRKMFYMDNLTENKIIHITNMNGIRELITEHKDSEESFCEDLWNSGFVEVLDKIRFEEEMIRFETELNRYADKTCFKHFDFLENEETLKTFLEQKNSICLEFDDDSIPGVIIDASLIPYITTKTISDVEYLAGRESGNIKPPVYYLTFHLDIDLLDIYSTYHFIDMDTNKKST